jgi:hypothetical protein
MRLILFLGAGVSKRSGLPTADGLTTRVLRSPYRQVGPRRFAPGRQANGALQGDDATQRIRALLRLLRAHDERDRKRVGYYRPAKTGRYKSSGAIYRSRTTYEDLFHLCQQMSLWNIGLVADSLTTPLMEVIERRAGALLHGRSVTARLSDLGSLASEAAVFIESVVASTLVCPRATGLDLVVALATDARVEQLNIVTLNHDTLVEQTLGDNGVTVVDGFGPPDGDIRWHDDTLYDAIGARVRLFKLHGSINWYSFRSSGSSRLGMLVGRDTGAAKDAAGAERGLAVRNPSFLTGVNKSTAYQRGIYGDLHFRFTELLRRCDKMVMSGYGWGDAAINFQLEAWLDHPGQHTLLFLHEHPDEIASNSLVVANGFDWWTRSGRLIPVRKWLEDATVADVWTHL